MLWNLTTGSVFKIFGIMEPKTLNLPKMSHIPLRTFYDLRKRTTSGRKVRISGESGAVPKLTGDDNRSRSRLTINHPKVSAAKFWP